MAKKARASHEDEYAEACACARKIAGAEPGDELCRAFAQAIVTAKGHELTVWNDMVVLTYENEFGPTCGVDDQIERMDMCGWADVAGYSVEGALALAGDPAKRVPPVYPTVTLTPEEGSSIVRRVTLSFRLPKRLHARLAKAVETLYKE